MSMSLIKEVWVKVPAGERPPETLYRVEVDGKPVYQGESYAQALSIAREYSRMGGTVTLERMELHHV